MGNKFPINPVLLEADSIWLEYSGRKVLQNIYIKVEKGEVVALVGRNGTGKSSLMKMIFGNLRGQNQSVRVNGNYLKFPYKHSNLIRYLPQGPLVPRSLTVEECFRFYEADQSVACHYFPELNNWLPVKTGDLSGGQLRLVEVLLVLLSPVHFVLLDEPFSQLAPIVVEKLVALIREVKENKGILLADHQYETVIALCERTYLIVPVGRSILLNEVRKELADYGYLNC
jgi:ABC-type multidrug transport system ATPase subunit